MLNPKPRGKPRDILVVKEVKLVLNPKPNLVLNPKPTLVLNPELNLALGAGGKLSMRFFINWRLKFKLYNLYNLNTKITH